MKKLLLIAVSLMLPLMTWGQAQIDTKKMKISDFTQKITKVVLTGNMFYDGCLKNEVAAKWHVSPFEFCTMSEYESLKKNDNYYFLLTTQGQFKKEKEPGLMFLSLLKGGKKAEEGLDDMLEIVSFPFASVEDPSGRELVFLPVFLDVIQNYALDSMEKDINAYTGLANYTLNITKTSDMDIVFSEGDLSAEITPEIKNHCFNEGVIVMGEEEADEYVTDIKPNTIVSYVAVPSEAKPGSFCYKMLVNPQDGTLYYFRKHKISKKVGPGFLSEDVRRIAAARSK